MIPDNIFEVISRLLSDRVRIWTTHGLHPSLKRAIYEDQFIKNKNEFEIILCSIFRTFKENTKDDFWVELSKLYEKRKLPGRSLRLRGKDVFVCSVTTAMDFIARGFEGVSESAARRVFHYVNSYDVIKLVRELYALEVGTHEAVEDLRRSIFERYVSKTTD